MKWDFEETILLVEMYYLCDGEYIEDAIVQYITAFDLRAEVLGLKSGNRPFRSRASIASKVQNVRFLDTKGRSGLANYSKQDKDVFDLYHNDNTKFSRHCLDIKAKYNIQETKIKEKVKKKPINEIIEQIPLARREQKWKPLASIYGFNRNFIRLECLFECMLEGPQSDDINQIIDNLELINEMSKRPELPKSWRTMPKTVREFLEWVSHDVDYVLNNWLAEQYKKAHVKTILQNRATGSTLQQCADILGLTRERVRQIESNTIKSFRLFNQKFDVIKVLQTDTNKHVIMNYEDVKSQIVNNTTEIIFLLKKSDIMNYLTCFYDEDMETFVFYPWWAWNRALQGFKNLPEVIPASAIDNIIKALKRPDEDELIYSFSATIIEELIKSRYLSNGKTYLRNENINPFGRNRESAFVLATHLLGLLREIFPRQVIDFEYSEHSIRVIRDGDPDDSVVIRPRTNAIQINIKRLNKTVPEFSKLLKDFTSAKILPRSYQVKILIDDFDKEKILLKRLILAAVR